jgi:flagellar biogenesis protein FliO
MIGVIFIAFVVAKKSLLTVNGANRKDQFLSIETSLNLGYKKTLYVIKAGEEKFLISSEPDKNTFLAKLEQQTKQQYEVYDDYDVNKTDDDLFIEQVNKITHPQKPSVMRGLLEKLLYQ